TGCSILGNSGGAATYRSTLDSCLVAFNLGGGTSGYWNGHAPEAVPVRNCTIVSNAIADAFHYGISSCEASNSIILFNGPDGTTNYGSLPSYLWYCCTRPLPANGFNCITNDPLFVDSANGNFRLQSNSPCINAGDNASVVTGIDLDGNPRT